MEKDEASAKDTRERWTSESLRDTVRAREIDKMKPEMGGKEIWYKCRMILDFHSQK